VKLHEKLAGARARLVAAGIAEAEASIDVDLYARTILGWDRAQLLTEMSGDVPGVLEPRFSEWIDRRQHREPTAYIVGVREFWGLDLAVTPAVLIPRPETEFVVEEALAVIAGNPAPRIADIGTGSGCLAIALAHDLPRSRVVASDVSDDALVVARQNAARHHVDARVEFIRTSYLDGVPGDFDLIVANPPYVKDRDKPALSRDVRHEPEVALFGGADGLRDIGGVLDTAGARLKSGGWFVMEFGYGQEDDVRALVAKRNALRLDHVRSDLQGIPRTAVMQKTPNSQIPMMLGVAELEVGS
jgi:release factor glutamine methyltransferase